jgi:hypothetical protein
MDGLAPEWRSEDGPTKHTHGTKRPCKIRCGINEGLFIKNDNSDVTEMYTDNLINCTQVILHNDRATFVCHIAGGARRPALYMWCACRKFSFKFGKVTRCYVISGESPAVGNELTPYLKGQLNIEIRRFTGVGGYSIDIHSSEAGIADIGWNTSQQAVAGWLTAPELIYERLTDREFIGDPGPGDYYASCPICKKL